MKQKQDGMALALAQAREAAKRGEVPVGAALLAGEEVVALAGNRMVAQENPLAHAEMLVLAQGAARLGRHRLAACSLYITLEPCAMCAGAILLARIKRLYYGAADAKFGAIEHHGRLFSQAGVNHRPEIYSGIGAEEAAALLRDFFAARRKKS